MYVYVRAYAGIVDHPIGADTIDLRSIPVMYNSISLFIIILYGAAISLLFNLLGEKERRKNRDKRQRQQWRRQQGHAKKFFFGGEIDASPNLNSG